MTNERAIELLHRLQDEQFDGIHGDERREALEMAVRAMSGDGDTIYRQDAIDIVRNRVKRFTTACVLAVTEIEKLPSAQPHWIPCSERLPNEDEEVLVTSNSGIFIAELSKERDKTIYWFEAVEGKSLHNVTAWMPLPKTYGGESDD